MQTDTDYYDGRWNKVSNVRLFFTELNIAFLPKDLINNCREELIEYTKHNESGVKNYFSTYGTSLETTHNIGKATELVNHSVERLARQIVKRKVSIANSFFNYVPKGCWHPKHSHGDKNMICAIVYFDDIGHTRFYDPRPQVFNFEWYPEEAEKGKVVFFPGWLEHEMPPHEEDEYRITMPFNMAIGE